MQVQTSSAKTSSSRQSTLSTINHLSKMTLSPKAEAKANGHPYPTPPNSQASSEVAESETDSQAHDDQSQPSPDLKHIFAIGDCAESGAIQAGHTAHWQAEVAARNILRLIDRQEGRARGEELEAYKPGVPAIKISLGLVSTCFLATTPCFVSTLCTRRSIVAFGIVTCLLRDFEDIT